MFNNANVIFRTKFVDGVSTVARTIGIGSSRARGMEDEADPDGSADDRGAARKSRGLRTPGRKGKENSVLI
jgi:structural maintenance of chromosome 2